MKYLKQRDGYSCGPIALKNAYIYKNKPKNNDPALRVTLKRLRRECRTNLTYGTPHYNLTNYREIPELQNLNLSRPVYNVNDIMNLDAFILLYSNVVTEHYVFVTHKRLHYHVYNGFNYNKRRHDHLILSPEKFQGLLNDCIPKLGVQYPVAWRIL